MDYPGISVIVAALNEENAIERCIDSLIEQSYPGPIEIIVADGGSKDKTREIVCKHISENGMVRLLDNIEKKQAAGRNLGIKESEYDLVAYIDAHSYADKDWLFNLYKVFDERKSNGEKIAGVGSVFRNAGSSSLSKSTETAFRSIISGATVDVFLKRNRVSKVNNAYACLYDKNALNETGLYNTSLATGEDMELNQRITEKYGYSLYVNPEAVTYYHRPETILGIFRQQYRYGFWRVRVMNLLGLYSLKVFLLPVFILAMAFMLVFTVFNPLSAISLGIVLFIYFVSIAGGSLLLSIRAKCSFLQLLLVFPAIHFGYGLGVIMGLIKSGRSDD